MEMSKSFSGVPRSAAKAKAESKTPWRLRVWKLGEVERLELEFSNRVFRMASSEFPGFLQVSTLEVPQFVISFSLEQGRYTVNVHKLLYELLRSRGLSASSSNKPCNS